MPKREMEVLTPQMYYVLLVLHQPMHGYEIMSEITRITNGEITVGAGSLYTLLPFDSSTPTLSNATEGVSML